jgi:hypothetical protein
MTRTLSIILAALAISASAVHAQADDASLPTVMKDGTHTKSHFEKTCTEVVNDGLAQGFRIETTCWKDYCQKHVSADYKNGDALDAFRLNYKNGEETRLFCVTTKDKINDRNCVASTGAFWREHYDGSVWSTTATYADHFEDEASGPSV